MYGTLHLQMAAKQDEKFTVVFNDRFAGIHRKEEGADDLYD